MLELKTIFKRKFIAFLFLISALTIPVFSQTTASDNFEKGEDLFSRNEPTKAIPYLKKACTEGNPKAYVYLSVAYFQTGQFEMSLDVCSAGMKATGTDKKILAYNAGNAAFALQNYPAAENWYSMAISADGFYSTPVLNRANAKLNQKKYLESVEDYKKYLMMEPNDPQEEQIRILIALIEEQIEADKLAEAERLEQEKRLREEAERMAAEEAERKRRLLESVANSLQNTDSEMMSAGAEDTVDYGYETELE